MSCAEVFFRVAAVCKNSTASSILFLHPNPMDEQEQSSIAAVPFWKVETEGSFIKQTKFSRYEHCSVQGISSGPYQKQVKLKF